MPVPDLVSDADPPTAPEMVTELDTLSIVVLPVSVMARPGAPMAVVPPVLMLPAKLIAEAAVEVKPAPKIKVDVPSLLPSVSDPAFPKLAALATRVLVPSTAMSYAPVPVASVPMSMLDEKVTFPV